MASTPSPADDPPTTPPAPRFGTYYDEWEPYQPRKSARISSQSRHTANRTPSPRAGYSRQTRSMHNTNSDEISGNMSPQKKRRPVPDSVHRDTGSLNAGEAATASSSSKSKSSRTPSKSLPTPTMTPRKSTSAKQAAGINSVSRNIFPADEKSFLGGGDRSKRTPKKLTGSTLESFEAQELDQDFPIYSDPVNRVPEKDESNPFYNPDPEPAQRQLRRRKVKVPGEGLKYVDEVAGRDDGLLMKFRGKTIFRHFCEPNESHSEDPDEVATDAPSPRKTFKPKLLWPSNPASEEPGTNAEEESTDVEDNNMGDLDSCPGTPSTPRRERGPPGAPKFGPVSPPDTRRTTRSGTKMAEEGTPVKKRAQPKLHFGSVAKSRASTLSCPEKRQGEPLAQDPVKRSRA